MGASASSPCRTVSARHRRPTTARTAARAARAACSVCNADKERATGVVLMDLIERGLRVKPGATHRHTLARVLLTPVQTLDGSWWMPLDYARRRPANRSEIERHLEAVAA